MVSNFFNPQEIPYDILKEYGVTEKMIEDLPEGIKQRFLSGKETAPLELILEDNGDEQKTFFAKISLVRKDDDSIDVMFHPEMNTIDLDSFAGKNAKLLREGKVVHTGDIVAQYDRNGISMFDMVHDACAGKNNLLNEIAFFALAFEDLDSAVENGAMERMSQSQWSTLEEEARCRGL